MKIGLTLDLSVNFWANGLQQNSVFLYEIIQRIGYKPYYITTKLPSHNLNFKHKAILLRDLMLDEQEVFDMILMVGYELPLEYILKLKSRNSKTKFIFIELGNSLLTDMSKVINPPAQNDPIFNDFNVNEHINGVWTSPHYANNKPYLSTLFNTDKVQICNYIWSPLFLQEKIKQLKSKNIDPFFNKSIKNVNVFEPNSTVSKCSLIPFLIAQKFDYMFPNELSSVNIFNSEKIRKSNYLSAWFNKFPITKNQKCFFNNRWSTLDAMAKFGGFIVSHHHKNSLNYAHFEALYMGLPLVHNSEDLMNYGYYYPDFDIKMAAMQLKSAFENHESTMTEDRRVAREFLSKFDYTNTANIHAYKKLIDES